MQFLKRHYEKIILAALLLLFIASLVYLIQIINSTNAVTRAELNIPTRAPDYVETDFNGEAFSNQVIFIKDTKWKASSARESEDKVFTDLVVPFECARCPYPNCGRIVPLYYFNNNPHKCPVCGGELQKPDKKAQQTAINTKVIEGDADGDGIPDIVEEKLGLNPREPEDSLQDMDNDGFSNAFEYKTIGPAYGAIAIGNVKVHPAMYLRLHLLDLRKTLLDITLKKVVPAGTKGDEFDVQLNIENGAKTLFKSLNDKVTLDKRPYEIVKIIPKFTKLQQGNLITDKDESTIVLNSVDGKYTVEMKCGEPVYSPNPKAIIMDGGIDEELTLDENEVFQMGTEKTGITRYKVTKIDLEKVAVDIKDLKTNKTYTITKKEAMPKIIRKGDARSSDRPFRPEENIVNAPVPK
ncbi:MAG: hypothetical protein ACYC4Q_04750 [Victivallaceae bacterium]